MATTAEDIRIATSKSLAYPLDDKRDLRIDFLRGVVMFILIIVHIDFFSMYNLLVWERVGVISGGEGFVILSGLVLGMIYGPRYRAGNAEAAIRSLVARALQLYKLNLVVILIFGAFLFVPFLDSSAVTAFTNQGTGEVYPLYPDTTSSLKAWIGRVVLLRSGPHQFQIIGLYVFLLALTPLVLLLLHKRFTAAVLTISWVLYVLNWYTPERITGAQFEYGFPLLTWQLTYIHGVAVGFHRERITEFFQDDRIRRGWLVVCGVLFLGFAFFTQNNPNPEMPEWARMSVIPEDTFRAIYSAWFKKNTLGLLRIVNYVAVLSLAYYALTRYWGVFNRWFGWYLIPLGQASLYAFVIHVFFVMVLSWIPVLDNGNVFANTLGHTFALLGIWFLVKTKFLFRWIPR